MNTWCLHHHCTVVPVQENWVSKFKTAIIYCSWANLL